jgi:hypothetical protein
MPENAKYDPMQKKEFFKNEMEVLKNMPSPSTPEVVEPIFMLTPHQPRIARDSSINLGGSWWPSTFSIELTFQAYGFDKP